MPRSLDRLLREVRACTLCAPHLEAGVRPVLQVHSQARILIAGQAPGQRVHASGVPFDDPSGDRLREWMGVTRELFWDPRQVAILPMGLCYPGASKSGDRPPRPECAPAWRHELLSHLPAIRLSLYVGQYAQRWHIDGPARNLTETVRAWADLGPTALPLPHPSPRNRPWLSRNPWFAERLLPELRARVARALR